MKTSKEITNIMNEALNTLVVNEVKKPIKLVKATKNELVKKSKIVKVKKAYVMPLTTKAKIEANNQWKDDTRSISAIYKYLQNEGKEKLTTFLSVNGSKLNYNHITKKGLIDNLKESEKTLKNGDKKQLFSLYVIYHAIGRIVKAEKVSK